MIQSAVIAGRNYVPRGWAFLLRTLAHLNPKLHQYRVILHDGDVLYLDLRERMCFGYLVYGRVQHEFGTERLIRETLRPGGCFVDVGANIGYFSRLAGRLVGSDGRVFAIEPMPAALALLRRNTRDMPNVTIFPVAVGEIQGDVSFYVRAKGDTSSLQPDPSARRHSVSLKRLDDVLSGIPRVDLLKIDVEGFEHSVIKGGLQSIELHRPVICFEQLLGNQASGCGLDSQACRVLRALDYHVCYLQQDSGPGPLGGSTCSSDLFAIPEELKHLYTA